MTFPNEDAAAGRRRTEWFPAPALALAAGLLAWAVLSRAGLFDGSTYISLSGNEPGLDNSRQVAAGLLGAAMALLPVVLGVRAVRLATEEHPSWVVPVARAAVLVGLLAVVLRTVAAVVAGVTHEGYYYYG